MSFSGFAFENGENTETLTNMFHGLAPTSEGES